LRRGLDQRYDDISRRETRPSAAAAAAATPRHRQPTDAAIEFVYSNQLRVCKRKAD